MIEKSAPSPFLQVAPPGVRQAGPSPSAVMPPAVREPADSVDLDPGAGLTAGKRAALVGLGLLSLAGPAWAGTGGAIAPAAAPVASQARFMEPATAAPPAGPLKLRRSNDIVVRGAEAGPADTTATGLKPGPGARSGLKLDADTTGLALDADTTGLKLDPSKVGADTTGAKPASDSTFSRAKRTEFLGAPSRDGSRTEIQYINDSFKDPFHWASDRDRNPVHDRTDDNGWTSEIRIDHIRTQGDRQDVTSGRFTMLTERGSWVPGPDYGGRRQDIAEIAHQRNFRIPVDERTDIHYGVGGGVQLVGPMGGRHIQEFWHEHAPFGGRLGEEEGLQYNYTTNHVSVSPMVTGGVGVFRRLDADGRWEARSTLQATLPVFGNSLGAVRAELGMRGYPGERWTVDAGVNVTGVYTNGSALDFVDTNGVRPGFHVSAEYRLTDHITPFARMDFGGLRDEPVYSIGVSINFGGKGEKARLDPLWR